MAFTGGAGSITAGSTETQDTLKTFLDANTSYGIMEYGGAVIRGASIVIPSARTFTLNYGECLVFDDAGKHCLQVNSGGTVDFKYGGSIVVNYNGNDGYNKLIGKINGENITYRANGNVTSGRFDHFGTTTSSDGMKNLTVVIGKGATGFQYYTHLQGLAGKITGLNLINDVTVAVGVWAIEFGNGAYDSVVFPSTTSKHGIANVNVTVALARNGGTTTLNTPAFPGSTYSLNTTGIAGSAYIKNETWPDNSGAMGSFTGAGSTDVYRQFDWYPGTYYTEGGWNVRLADSKATPTVYQNAVVTSSAAIPLTWQYFKNSVATNYTPFKILARKVGFIGRYETFTPTTPRTESFLPIVDETYTSDQSALTGIAANNSTKTLTISAGTKTLDQVYDWFQWWMAQSAQMAAFNTSGKIDSVTGTNWTLPSGWTLVVSSGAVLNAGTKLTYIYVPTITNNGTITCIYASAAGTSTTWRFDDVQVGSSIVVYDASGVTKYFQGSITSAGDYNYYIPPGTTGTYYWAIEKYGKQRESGSFAANTGGLLSHTSLYVEDVGISQTTQATVAAYTTLETNSKLYDYIAYFRLSEQGIKLGQIATRSGTSIEFGSYSGIIKSTHTSVLSITGSTITIKANGLAGDTKYATIIATPPATWTANTTEVITTEIEDGNGDSSITISASSVSTFEIWKITDATSPDDYATGILVATVGVGKWRFLHSNGYKFVVRDTTTNYRVVVEAEKGTYKAELYFGAGVQLAQAAEVSQINTKVDIMQIDLEAIKGTGFAKDAHSLTNIKKKASLAAALSA